MSIDWNSVVSQTQTLNPQAVNASASMLSAIAQNTYNQAKLQGDSDRLAFDKAQAALTQAGNLGTQYGYAPGGNWYTFGPGGPTQPPAGTPTQSAISQWQTLANQQLANQATIAGQTGYFAQPVASQYTPGTILTAPSTTPGLGPAYGIVNTDGSVQMTSAEGLAQTAAQRGTNAQALMAGAQPVDWNTLQRLAMGPPTGPSTPTLDYQKQQQAAAYNAGQLTGFYTDPTQTLAAYNARGETIGGGTFDQLPGDQQAFWLQYNQNDRTRAAQAWAQGTNQALVNAGVPIPNQNAPTLQMQALYGAYGAPTAGQQTMAQQEQNYTQWLRSTQEARLNQQLQQQTAQGYLDLLSRLRGPADYAKYQQVLGATPGGMSDLVRAAAGQYIPGGGATTGTQPQAVTLPGFVNQVTGGGTVQQSQQDLQNAQNSLVAPNQMAPQTWNNLAPSQQQMLLGVWESQGYTQDDAKNLFQQSLPKYATTTPAIGQFRLQ